MSPPWYLENRNERCVDLLIHFYTKSPKPLTIPLTIKAVSVVQYSRVYSHKLSSDWKVSGNDALYANKTNILYSNGNSMRQVLTGEEIMNLNGMNIRSPWAHTGWFSLDIEHKIKQKHKWSMNHNSQDFSSYFNIGKNQHHGIWCNGKSWISLNDSTKKCSWFFWGGNLSIYHP